MASQQEIEKRRRDITRWFDANAMICPTPIFRHCGRGDVGGTGDVVWETFKGTAVELRVNLKAWLENVTPAEGDTLVCVHADVTDADGTVRVGAPLGRKDLSGITTSDGNVAHASSSATALATVPAGDAALASASMVNVMHGLAKAANAGIQGTLVKFAALAQSQGEFATRTYDRNEALQVKYEEMVERKDRIIFALQEKLLAKSDAEQAITVRKLELESHEKLLGAKIKMWMHTLETGGNLVGAMMENASLAKMFMRVATELEPEIAGEIGLRIMAGVRSNTREELMSLLETHGISLESFNGVAA